MEKCCLHFQPFLLCESMDDASVSCDAAPIDMRGHATHNSSSVNQGFFSVRVQGKALRDRISSSSSSPLALNVAQSDAVPKSAQELFTRVWRV